MKSLHLLLLISQPLLGLAPALRADISADHAGHHAQVAALTEAEKTFLAGYEAVRAALAVDDLSAAKNAAATISDSQPAAGLGKVQTLDQARVLFTKLSRQAVPLVSGRPGFFIASCPMAGSDWVQTAKEISNPYLGKKMPTCGTIKD